MAKANNSSELDSHFFETDFGKYLKTAAVFGANASGKTGLVMALNHAVMMVRTATPDGRPVPIFKLNAQAPTTDAEFEFDLLVNGKKYWYSFAIKNSKISYEILKQINKNESEIEVFEREDTQFTCSNKALTKEETELFPSLFKLVKSHNLFLTELITRQTTLSPLIDWFMTKFIFLNDVTLNAFAENIKREFSSDQLIQLSQYLRNADFGINQIAVGENKHKEIVFTLASKILSSELLAGPQGNEMLKNLEKQLVLTHSADHGMSAEFDIYEESDGTQKFLKMISLMFRMNEGLTIVMDEYERSLHPMLGIHFLEQFFKANERFNSQFIFTSHNHALIDAKILRQDEIWFMQKQKDQSSRLYSLAEFKERKERNLGKDYLDGRFEAVPVFSHLPISGKKNRG